MDKWEHSCLFFSSYVRRALARLNEGQTPPKEKQVRREFADGFGCLVRRCKLLHTPRNCLPQAVQHRKEGVSYSLR